MDYNSCVFIPAVMEYQIHNYLCMFIVDINITRKHFLIKPEGLKRVEKLDQPTWFTSIYASTMT